MLKWVVIMKAACFTLNAELSTLNANSLRLIAVVFLVLTFSFQLSAFNSIHAQNAPTLGGVAVNIEIDDSNVQAGDIISATKEGFKRSTEEYDVLIFGVVTNAPILSVEPRTDITRAVVSSGEAQVRVSAENGEIEEGDLITSSVDAGLGQKATRSGYVIGKALQSYNNSEPGLIAVLVSPSFGSSGIGGAAGSILSVFGDPENARLILASILGIVVLVGGAAAVTRLVTAGVAAVGRNPLAKSTIYKSMVITGSVIAILALVGIGLIVTIIRLSG